MTTKWGIVSRVQNRVKDIPVGSAVIVQFVEDASNDISNITGQSIDLTNIGSTWHGILTNLGAAYTLGYMNGVGVSYNLGRMAVNKTTELQGQELQMKFLLDQVTASLNMLGKPIRHDKVEPTT